LLGLDSYRAGAGITRFFVWSGICFIFLVDPTCVIAGPRDIPGRDASELVVE
jgi:hypothetical protein